ncbi:HigA family addiction module antitoxin [Arabiibacter massiliensis]|uniref:HigA family addiction module antitoxin n=1 Tax=Arabiibacter massiliensis TaxID=1870985 RepID=UPI001E407AA4|nr:HigA family addiction module antitoxin [Arabiibacter massiliensis]
MVDAAISLADVRGSFGGRMRAVDEREGGRCAVAMEDGQLLQFRFEDGNAFDVGFIESEREREKGPSRQLTIVARRPTHPGEVLREELMPAYGLTVAGLAKRLGVSRQSVNELVRERRALSTDMALRLARLFGTSAEYWLALQRGVDLWDTLELRREDLDAIESVADGGCDDEGSEKEGCGR